MSAEMVLQGSPNANTAAKTEKVQGGNTVRFKGINVIEHSIGTGHNYMPLRKRHVSTSSTSDGRIAGAQKNIGSQQFSTIKAVSSPSRFLLGGNVRDPLNLASLNDEDVNRLLNAVTPKSSPIPTPAHRKEAVEVIIPSNIYDPLNLNSAEEGHICCRSVQNAEAGCGKKKRNKKRNKRKRTVSDSEQIGSKRKRTISDCEPVASEAVPEGTNARENKSVQDFIELSTVTSEKCLLTETQASEEIGTSSSWHADIKHPCKTRKKRKSTHSATKLENVSEQRSKEKDEIVSPVVPISKTVPSDSVSPRSKRRKQSAAGSVSRTLSMSRYHSIDVGKISNKILPTCVSSKQESFSYGNCANWVKGSSDEADHRLNCLKKAWFEDKDVLDVGCNTGRVTMYIAKNMNPKHIVGLDIDNTLINAAKKSVRQECASHNKKLLSFPTSMAFTYGPTGAAYCLEQASNEFPNNISFVQVGVVKYVFAIICSTSIKN